MLVVSSELGGLNAELNFQRKLDSLYDAMWRMNLKNNIPKSKVFDGENRMNS